MLEATTPITKGMGAVTSNLERGELFLRDEEGKVYRLRWTAGEDDQERSLPLGTYVLVGYRIVEGKWHLSASGGRRKVVVGETPTRVIVSKGVAIDFRAKPRGSQLSLQMGIAGGDGLGMSIFKDGARIPIRYRLTGKKDAEVAAGPMNYG